MRASSLALAAAALFALPAAAAITLDSTTCAGSVVSGCPAEHVTTTLASFVAGVATVNFPTAIGCSTSGTVLYAVVLDEAHGGGTTTGVPVVLASAGGAANYSTAWTLVTGSSTASVNGAAAVYRAVCAGAFTGEVPRLTVSCTGGSSLCAGTNSASQESHVQVFGFSVIFSAAGNASATNSAAGTPSRTLTTSSGDKLLMSWSDFSGASCTQTVTSGAAAIDQWATAGTTPSPCASGNSDYFVSEWTSGTTAAGSTTIGVSSPTNAIGAWTAVEICDSTATSCPNGAAAVTCTRTLMGVGC
jgi:hypothetical protein